MRRPQRSLFLLAALAAAALFGSSRAAPPPADELGPLLDAVRSAVADGRVVQSKTLGFDHKKGDFTESPSEPGVLIGFDLGLGKFFDIETIYAYRAVFETAHGDEVLADHGLFRDKPGTKKTQLKTKVLHTVHVRARPGYAVGRLTLRSGLLINGLSVTFMRIKDGKLDPDQSYESDWVGDRTGGSESSVGGDGAPVMGISGSQDDEHASSLGLIFTTDPAPAVVPPAAAPPVVKPPAIPPVQPPAPAVQPPHAPVRFENPPPPPLADPPAEPPQPPAEPAQHPDANAQQQASAPPAAEKSSSDLLLAYGLPVAALIVVAGLALIFALTSLNRKGQLGRRPANRAAPPMALPVAVPLPSTALCERPAPRRRAADDEALELTAEDIVRDPPLAAALNDAPKTSPPSSDGWPQVKL